ncbi:MAG: hypothetical protein R2764_05745 [Bacteroidales bacterium]
MAILPDDFEHEVGNLDEQVKLTVKLGDNQHVAHYILHTPDGKYHKLPFDNYEIGKGKELKGNDSKLTVVVTDTNSLTNFTSIIVTLSNKLKTEIYSKASDIDNGTVIYIITIKHR